MNRRYHMRERMVMGARLTPKQALERYWEKRLKVEPDWIEQCAARMNAARKDPDGDMQVGVGLLERQ